MNLKTNVIATDITNLTDARYFAAWGVQYMSYAIDDTHPSFIGQEGIKEIIDWVEGPINLGQLSGLSVPITAAQIYTDLGLQGLVCGPFISADTTYTISPKVWKEVTDISLLEGMSEELLIVKLPHDADLQAVTPALKATAASNEVYLDGIPSVEVLASVLDSVKPAGIVLRGGEEEKVGFKSYDELDQFFEWLEVD